MMLFLYISSEKRITYKTVLIFRWEHLYGIFQVTLIISNLYDIVK